jgi:hypothetical protein
VRKRTAQQIEERKSVNAPNPKPPSKRGKHPNSRKNLRPPWPKGKSGNPGGMPGTDLAAAIARRAFEDNPGEILAGFADQLSKGNAYAFSVLADRGYGKLKEKIEHSGVIGLADRLANIRKRKNAGT